MRLMPIFPAALAAAAAAAAVPPCIDRMYTACCPWLGQVDKVAFITEHDQLLATTMPCLQMIAVVPALAC
jgi:hypothetical protein